MESVSESDTVKLFRKDELVMEREQTTIRLQNKLYYKLKLISQQTGLNITVLIIIAIYWHILKPEKRLT